MRNLLVLTLLALGSATALYNPLTELNVLQEQVVGIRPPPGEKMGESLYLCGNDNDLVTIDSVELSPDPPSKGNRLVIKGSGTVHQTIHEGSIVKITVKYGFIKLLTKEYQLCDLVKEIDQTCPIQPGHLSFTKEVDIPGEIPKGIFTVYAEAFEAQSSLVRRRVLDSPAKAAFGKRITCVNAQVQF
ncbi:Phosphatidylglycerol/phosphatidylinositol transfer protein [Dispira parvispora]|uniref:Phosphatidylglycerol/phosphatidylinositol transfer protein n=1 Tax=Dispira parvispora TaxID=1520584 RepID=A0A9W8ATW9_9FUNG|nr:Phosphatidylglycerol/phosphatidylinositol transfer protein [Dispira parvispora]